MEVEFWLLSLLPTLLVLIVAWIARLQFKSWLAPSAFWALFWGLDILTMLILSPDFYFWYGAAWYVLVCAICLHIGMIIGFSLSRFSQRKNVLLNTKNVFQMRWAPQIFIVCAVLGLFANSLTLHSRGNTLLQLLNPEALAQLAREFSVARYFESYNPPYIARALMVFVFLGASFSGIWLATCPNRRERWLAILPFVPAVIQAIILTARAMLIIPFFLCVACLCATLVLKREQLYIWSFRQFYRVSMILVISVIMYIALQVLREGATLEGIGVTFQKAKVSFLGSPAVFSQWLEDVWMKPIRPSWGFYNFAGLFDLIGMTPREQGLYSENILLGKNDHQSYQSNIYTAFRGLIQDFTLFGSLVIHGAVGLGIGAVFRQIKGGKAIYLPILALFYAFTLWSHVSSLLNENSIILALILLFVCLVPTRFRVLRRTPATFFVASRMSFASHNQKEQAIVSW